MILPEIKDNQVQRQRATKSTMFFRSLRFIAFAKKVTFQVNLIEFVFAPILHLHRPRGNVVGMKFPQWRLGHHVFVEVGDDESRRALSAEQVLDLMPYSAVPSCDAMYSRVA